MSGRCRRRGRVKALNILTPHEIAWHGVLKTILTIWTTSEDIDAKRDESASHISTATLDRIADLSALLREEIQPLPMSTMPFLQEPLTVYKLILVDIRDHILASDEPIEVSDYIINQRLDAFAIQFQESMDRLRDTVDQKNSTNFFANARDVAILGGSFNSVTNNPVVYDPVLREQSHKILRALYFNCGVLFAYPARQIPNPPT